MMSGPGCASPRSQAELHDALATFAARGTDALVIDGGDGTVRDVMSAAAVHFPHGLPRIAVVPSGKTNALAHDLGIPRDWTIGSALHAVRNGRTALRAPLEVSYAERHRHKLLGFIWGTGAFVRATAMAQTTHRFGAFNGLAVRLSIAGAIAQALFGRSDDTWRAGDRMLIEAAGGGAIEREHYLMLASTLTQLPSGVKPFGKSLRGLKLLCIDSPPKRLVTRLPGLLMGSESPALARDGFHRRSIDRMRLRLNSNFVLDGEVFDGGDITLRKHEPIGFVVP